MVQTAPECDDVRTSLAPEDVRQAILDNLYFQLGRTPELASRRDWYMAVAYTVRERMLNAWVAGMRRISENRNVRAVAYLSAEFLIGPQLGANLLAMGAADVFREALSGLGQNFDDLLGAEAEPGLGNGGLGRLAACYLDSLATLGVLAMGYGIRYEFGLFTQNIQDGWQVEASDAWLRGGFPWEMVKPEIAFEVGLGGRTETFVDAAGRSRVRWLPVKVVRGVAHDVPVLGHGGQACNLLRLWRAEAVASFDFAAFNVGDYFKAVEEKIISETISKVLYPNDDRYRGKQLRLGQQFFFVSCSLQDMIRVHLLMGHPLERFHESFAAQLNDTHPAIAVAELMRLLVDEHVMDWDTAWEVTRRTFCYTNHTLLPEALEKWPLPLFAEVLPRHLEIVFEINRRFLDQVRALRPGDDGLVAGLSLIDESGPKYVRMAHLASVGSGRINGVAALHSHLLQSDVLRDFAAISPEKFTNVTNGVTPRRWLALANPRLAELISSRIGSGWLTRFEEEIVRLEPLAEDAGFRAAWREIKLANKRDLAALVAARTGVVLDPAAMFDVQVKRIHEYKRQHLNLLRLVALYLDLKRNPGRDGVPRAAIFGGKAAPGYYLAKLIIRAVNAVAATINADPDTAGRLRVAFIPDFNVATGQRIYPAADLSQQISLAGKEASGTGNMKFTMNGALTIGTLDGANVEIREHVGPENFFLFGLSAEGVARVRSEGYDPRAAAAADPVLSEVLEALGSGRFSPGDPGLFRPLVDNLLYQDEYLVLADFAAYMEACARVDAAWRDPDAWTRMSILNTARSGYFSSDRSIREYCREIWRTPTGSHGAA